MTQMQFIEWSNPDAAFYTRLYQLLDITGRRGDSHLPTRYRRRLTGRFIDRCEVWHEAGPGDRG